jgi:dTDP-4-dehydrorhamnose reductase
VPTPASDPRPLAWITGAGGLIGHHLVLTAPHHAPQWRVRPLTRADLDLTRFHALDQLFRHEQPQLVIHCAALSRTTTCQNQPAFAQLINLTLTTHLASLAQAIPFVFFSSDLVFDGRQGHYAESDRPNPLNVYGQTKLEAEEFILRNPRHTVIRTSLNAGPSPSGLRAFDEELRHAWREARIPRLFTDEFRCPLPAHATARATWELVCHKATGLFHVAGPERLSRFQIGHRLATLHSHLNPRIEPASVNDLPGPPRAADTSLHCAKAQALLSFAIPSFPPPPPA